MYPVPLADTDRAKDLATESEDISVRDAIHAAVMMNNDFRAIAAFDKGFDRISGIERLTLE